MKRRYYAIIKNHKGRLIDVISASSNDILTTRIVLKYEVPNIVCHFFNQNTFRQIYDAGQEIINKFYGVIYDTRKAEIIAGNNSAGVLWMLKRRMDKWPHAGCDCFVLTGSELKRIVQEYRKVPR